MRHVILIASNNAHKLLELREITALAGAGAAVRLVTPAELGLALDPDESALTYAENALIKARAFAQALGWGDTAPIAGPGWVMADDSGLEVDALNGRPGVHSARYHQAAPGGDGCAALLAELTSVDAPRRGARFRCAMALIGQDGRERLFEGVCEGSIGPDKRGTNGFGFDPVFMPRGESRHLAEMSSGEKHAISHRGVAMRRVLQDLESWRP